MATVNRAKTVWIAAVVGIVLLAGLVYYWAQPKGSDSEQIQDVLKAATAASRSGKAGSVLDLLSKALEVNGARPEMKDVAAAIRQYKPDFDVQSTSLNISGDDANMEAHVRVHGTFLGASVDTSLDRVGLQFHRESATAFGIVPIRAWRLQKIEFNGPLPDNLPISGWIRGVGDL